MHYSAKLLPVLLGALNLLSVQATGDVSADATVDTQVSQALSGI